MTAPDERRLGTEPAVAPPARSGPDTSAAAPDERRPATERAVARPAAARRKAVSGIPAGLGPEQLLDLYTFMRLTRSLEERLTNLYRRGNSHSHNLCTREVLRALCGVP